MTLGSDSKLKVLWHWYAMGPYHFARMSAVAKQPGIELTVVETTSDDDHGWQRDDQDLPFRLITLSKEHLSSATHRATASSLERVLHETNPDIFIASGYGEPHSRFVTLRYLRERPETNCLLWSETTSFDHRRKQIMEAVKSELLKAFDGALVAGTPHRRYLMDLGMRGEDIQVVGGCVDNAYFAESADAARTEASPIHRPFFLYVGRFIPVKNLSMLVRAYHLYRVMTSGPVYDLVLVGSGPEMPALKSLVDDLHLDGVHFEGLKQVQELPRYYAHASAFVLPSYSEPWGLVVNEAMAAGLPILASTQVGSAEDLVIPGETGYLFDPYRPEELAASLEAIAQDKANKSMGMAARKQVERFSIERYAPSVTDHIRAVHGRKRLSSDTLLIPRVISQIEHWIR